MAVQLLRRGRGLVLPPKAASLGRTRQLQISAISRDWRCVSEPDTMFISLLFYNIYIICEYVANRPAIHIHTTSSSYT